MKYSIKHMIREEAPSPEGDGGAGGGAPTQDILGGSKPPVQAKPEPTGTVEEGWLAGVSREWAEDPSLQSVQSLEDLAKGYVHAQRLVGKDKVVIPSEHATDEERRQFLHKLGLPNKLEEYGVSRPEESSLGEEFVNDFVSKAYEQGIMPAQAKTMLNWYEEKSAEEQSNHVAMMENQIKTTVEELKADYGQAYDSKINLANKVISDTMDEATLDKMRESGLLSNKEFIQTMVKIGEGLVQEGKFNHEPQADGRLTPSEAKRKIGEIQGDSSHPYHNRNHPNHEIAVKEVTELFEYVG